MRIIVRPDDENLYLSRNIFCLLSSCFVCPVYFSPSVLLGVKMGFVALLGFVADVERFGMYVQASRRFSLPGDGGLDIFFEHTRNVSEHPGRLLFLLVSPSVVDFFDFAM